MRGPDLVGYPPDGLRWSADSQKLYFDWRKPGEDEASTYVVGRDGGAPAKLTDEEKKNAPPANGGRWDKARKRVLFADRGDIVMLDAGGTRRWITRTTAGEGSPRWARNDTAVTYVRDGNLFIVPLDGAGRHRPAADRRRAEARRAAADRQPEVHPRRTGEAARSGARGQKEQKKKADEKDKQDKLPGARAAGSADRRGPDAVARRHPRVRPRRRAPGRRAQHHRPELRHRDRLQPKTFPGGRPSATRRTARCSPILNLKTGKTVVGRRQLRAAGRRTARRRRDAAPRADDGAERRQEEREREIRWSMPDVSDDGRLAVAAARSADNKDRWYRGARCRNRQDPRRRHAARRRVGPRGGRRIRIVRRRVPARQQARVVPLGARRLDAPLHARRQPTRRRKRSS